MTTRAKAKDNGHQPVIELPSLDLTNQERGLLLLMLEQSNFPSSDLKMLAASVQSKLEAQAAQVT